MVSQSLMLINFPNKLKTKELVLALETVWKFSEINGASENYKDQFR